MKAYIISVLRKREKGVLALEHFKVLISGHQQHEILYEIEGTGRPYDNFYTLLNFYRSSLVSREKNIDGIGVFLEPDYDATLNRKGM